MEQFDEPQNAGIPGNGVADASLDLINPNNAAMVAENSDRRAPLPWTGVIPRFSYGVMAVVDQDGYLVPVFTAGDLLRACKMIWQATED